METKPNEEEREKEEEEESRKKTLNIQLNVICRSPNRFDDQKLSNEMGKIIFMLSFCIFIKFARK